MRLDSRAFGLAAAAMAAALFTLCAVAVALVPAPTTAVASTLIHLDLSGMARTLTWGSFFGGFVGWTLGVGLVFGGVSGLYNRLVGGVTSVARPGVAHRAA